MKNFYFKLYLFTPLFLYNLHNYFKNEYFLIYFLIIMVILNLSMNKTINMLMMNLLIFILTLLFTINLNYLFNSNWYSIMIFLIMISGLMVLFLYFNSFLLKKPKMDYIFLKLFIDKLVMMNIFMFMMYKLMILLKMSFLNLLDSLNMSKFIMNEQIMMFLINSDINQSILFMIFYLLLSMIIVSQLVKFKNKAMRMTVI